MLNESQDKEDEARGSRGEYHHSWEPEMLTESDHLSSSRKLVLADILLTVWSIWEKYTVHNRPLKSKNDLTWGNPPYSGLQLQPPPATHE